MISTIKLLAREIKECRKIDGRDRRHQRFCNGENETRAKI